jgi:hypothetical protein
MKNLPVLLFVFGALLSACKEQKTTGELTHSGGRLASTVEAEAEFEAAAYHYKDTRDGGDNPMMAGCHLEYDDMMCMNRTSNQLGDECDPNDPRRLELLEWIDTVCHPPVPLDRKGYNCDTECKRRFPGSIGCCAYQMINCGTNPMMPSAECKCVMPGQNCP